MAVFTTVHGGTLLASSALLLSLMLLLLLAGLLEAGLAAREGPRDSSRNSITVAHNIVYGLIGYRKERIKGGKVRLDI